MESYILKDASLSSIFHTNKKDYKTTGIDRRQKYLITASNQTMRKGRKRKAGQPCIASKSITQSQLSNIYSPAIRSRAHGLSPLNLQLMQDSFLSNDNIK